MIENTLLAYLAGIIDGEGWVGLQSRGKGRAKEFMVHVNMTDRDTIELLHSTFGGCMYNKKVPNKPQYSWRVKNARAKETFALLKPYLRIKKTPVELAGIP